ncbi:class I adenylate-forming enzyme family protein [Pandoraea terrigena]|uniref:Long-chain-fatty-acid--CoA ligase FadD13 n=1 Tax=Pandoraea terrigena TaxID=2508292 RepID=A0A5E4X5X1_9BURK|nr:AMP-binding protein [Pandoraea terrigena]VVE31686.1 Long-chain-fatty-acid--CoA ligase FadD13 [Pandoraea terrigena]
MTPFVEALARHARATPQRLALRCGVGDEAQQTDFAALWRRIERVGGHLRGTWHIAPGDRVACLGLNDELQLALLFACARAGAIFLPLNFRLAVPELAAIVRHAGVRVLWSDAAHRDMARQIRDALEPVTSTDVPPPSIASIEGLIAVPSIKPVDYPDVAADAPVLLAYTSGTTGEPKGALHTQSGLLANAGASWWAHEMCADDHVLSTLPMFHVGGLCIQTLPALLCGASVTLHPRFDPAAWLTDVLKHRPTLSLMVPATMRAVQCHPLWQTTDLSSLRGVMAGSSVVPMSAIDAFHARGIPLGQVYGATETGPVSIALRFGEAKAHPGAVGRPCPGVDIRLIDAAGQDVLTGEVGEILVRAPNVMREYWRAPNHVAFEDGWFHSGDLARWGEDGCLEVVGRSKDMIISGGENIYPAEIENALIDCPGVLEAAVVGVPDERWGEVSVAVIVAAPSASATQQSVLDFLGTRIARFKLPRRVVVVDALPKSALGKVQKPILIEWLSSAYESGKSTVRP